MIRPALAPPRLPAAVKNSPAALPRAARHHQSGSAAKEGAAAPLIAVAAMPPATTPLRPAPLALPTRINPEIETPASNRRSPAIRGKRWNHDRNKRGRRAMDKRLKQQRQ